MRHKTIEPFNVKNVLTAYIKQNTFREEKRCDIYRKIHLRQENEAHTTAHTIGSHRMQLILAEEGGLTPQACIDAEGAPAAKRPTAG